MGQLSLSAHGQSGANAPFGFRFAPTRPPITWSVKYAPCQADELHAQVWAVAGNGDADAQRQAQMQAPWVGASPGRGGGGEGWRGTANGGMQAHPQPARHSNRMQAQR